MVPAQFWWELPKITPVVNYLRKILDSACKIFKYVATTFSFIGIVFRIVDVGTAVYFSVLAPIEVSFFLSHPYVLRKTGYVFCAVRLIIGLFSLVHAIISAQDSSRIISLTLDLIGALPYRLIAHHTHPRVVYVLLLRLLQLRRFDEGQDSIDTFFRSRVQGSRRAYYGLMMFRLLKIVLLDLYWIHLCACVLYYTAIAQEDRKHTWIATITTFPGITFTSFETLSFWEVYSTSSYFAFVMTSTVGFGDLHPTTLVEAWVMKGILTINGIVVLMSAHMGNNLVQKFLADRRARRGAQEDGDP